MKLKIITLALLGLVGAILGAARPKKTTVAPPDPPTRPPQPPNPGLTLAGRIAQQAVTELQTWLKHSTAAEERAQIETYWQAVSREPWTGEFWSAAFVVFVTNKAAPRSLLRSASHWGYARAGFSVVRPGAYRTVNPQSHVIQVGDIIVRNRKGGTFTFSDLDRISFQPSHGDIVIEVNTHFATAIGGNKTGGTVASEKYPLDAGGKHTSAITIMTLNPELPSV